MEETDYFNGLYMDCDNYEDFYSTQSIDRTSLRREISNKEYLLDIIMKQLDINNDDLKKEESFIKAKVRDYKINNILK